MSILWDYSQSHSLLGEWQRSWMINQIRWLHRSITSYTWLITGYTSMGDSCSSQSNRRYSAVSNCCHKILRVGPAKIHLCFILWPVIIFTTYFRVLQSIWILSWEGSCRTILLILTRKSSPPSGGEIIWTDLQHYLDSVEWHDCCRHGTRRPWTWCCSDRTSRASSPCWSTWPARA